MVNMNILLRNKVRWFLRYANEETKEIINKLLDEIKNVELYRSNDEKRYTEKYRELISQKKLLGENVF